MGNAAGQHRNAGGVVRPGTCEKGRGEQLCPAALRRTFIFPGGAAPYPTEGEAGAGWQ